MKGERKMASAYTNIHSNFPASIMERTSFKDITPEVASKIAFVESLIANNDIASANKHIEEYELEDYFINADSFNWAFEEIRNTQIYAKTKGQQVIYVDSINDLPSAPANGDIYRVRRTTL